jgi:hypothetical protein
MTLDQVQIGELTAASKVRALLRRFTYKPGWTFTLMSDHTSSFSSWSGPDAIRVVFNAPDAYHPERVTEVGAVISVPYALADADDDMLCAWLFEQVLAIERHEAGEFFAVDGRRPFDPHAR